MLTLLHSTLRIVKVLKWKAKILSRVNVKAFAFCILHSGSEEVEIQMLSRMNVEAPTFCIPHGGSVEVERQMFKSYND